MQKLTSVRNLKPGDILPAIPAGVSNMGVPRRVILATEMTPRSNFYNVQMAYLGPFDKCPTVFALWGADVEVEIEGCADLTPAQQHADSLLGAARNYLTVLRSFNRPNELTVKALEVLIERADPTPKPPTLYDALDILRRVQADHPDPMLACDIESLLARVPNKQGELT